MFLSPKCTSWLGFFTISFSIAFLIFIHLYGKIKKQKEKEVNIKNNSLIEVIISGEKRYVLEFIGLLEAKGLKFKKKPRRLTRRERSNLSKTRPKGFIQDKLLVSEVCIDEFETMVREFNVYGQKITVNF